MPAVWLRVKRLPWIRLPDEGTFLALSSLASKNGLRRGYRAEAAVADEVVQHLVIVALKLETGLGRLPFPARSSIIALGQPSLAPKSTPKSEIRRTMLCRTIVRADCPGTQVATCEFGHLPAAMVLVGLVGQPWNRLPSTTVSTASYRSSEPSQDAVGPVVVI